MKIDMAGQYRTRGNHMAEVAAIKRTFALGWVKKRGGFTPTSWDTSDGTVYTGGCGDDLVAVWKAPRDAPTDPRIPAPGLYRDELGRKVEIVAIRGTLAIGLWPDVCPPAGGSWDVATGYDQRDPNRSSNLMGQWCEPASMTLELQMIRGADGKPLVYLNDPTCSPSEHMIARKAVTITEGEGMS